MVFDPEYINLDCPKCNLRRIYFDRDIGYYCMSCGHQVSSDNIVMLIEKNERTSQPTPAPDTSVTSPPPEIKEMPSKRIRKPKRAGKDLTEHDPSEKVARND